MRYLTKSRFKQALECPDKLFYSGKKEYADVRKDNEFLRELAKGGMQVGELAKCYFPGGIEITAPDNTTALADTQKYLQQENVTLFEAAIAFENLLVRVDVLVKKGNVINLYEVKSKSYREEAEIYYKQKKEIRAGWFEYVYDIAFQVFVVRQAFPSCSVHGALMLINKNIECDVEELYQKFLVRKTGDRYHVISHPDVSVGKPILSTVDLDDTIETIINGSESLGGQLLPFAEYVKALSTAYRDDKQINVQVSTACKKCEYRALAEHKMNGLLSGYETCWTNKLRFTPADFDKPHVFDIWNLSADSLLLEQRYFLHMLKEADFEKEKSTSKRLLPPHKRQWLQIERALNPSLGSYIDREGLQLEFKKMKYPLHFIDFETTRNAIPYIKGLQPYTQLMFQFSHHVIDANGTSTHAGEWINQKRAVYPNFEFVRELKKQLEKDDGSIFIYSSFENTAMNDIYRSLKASNEHDKDELMTFIRSVTWSTADKWIGPRKFIDMKDWVLDFYYSPMMKGSNSIKYVLPAIINDSKYLQDKYPEWIRRDANGVIINPYKLLPPVFDNISRDDIEGTLSEDDDLADGGAAMCAYNLMQYAEMSEKERGLIVQALLKYCKLDTLAMVMLFEGLKNL